VVPAVKGVTPKHLSVPLQGFGHKRTPYAHGFRSGYRAHQEGYLPPTPHPLNADSLRFPLPLGNMNLCSLFVRCPKARQNHLARLPVIEKRIVPPDVNKWGRAARPDERRSVSLIQRPLVQRDERASVHSRLHVIYKTEPMDTRIRSSLLGTTATRS